VRIAMTGATSGIGLRAAGRLLAREGCSLTVAARNPGSVPRALRRGVEIQPVDLADLQSVRSLAARLRAGKPIDALVLNAAVQCAEYRTSVDGYELTFAVNHLAHYLLLRLLTPHLAQGARVIITSSGTHNPLTGTRMPPPRHAHARWLALPGTDPGLEQSRRQAARRAYTSSKLCNVMTARELASRLAAERSDVSVCAFDPGLTPGTRLARDYPWPIGPLFQYLLPLILRPSARISTPAIAGQYLAELVTSPEYRAARGEYFAIRDRRLGATLPSTLARDDEACEDLWIESGMLVGMPAEAPAAPPQPAAAAERRDESAQRRLEVFLNQPAVEP
jgi:NAD(P)-dependent dehydrogenase (short-subunit alcohol dehydrogenase family)